MFIEYGLDDYSLTQSNLAAIFQVEALSEVERAFVHVDYQQRLDPEHKVERALLRHADSQGLGTLESQGSGRSGSGRVLSPQTSGGGINCAASAAAGAGAAGSDPGGSSRHSSSSGGKREGAPGEKGAAQAEVV